MTVTLWISRLSESISVRTYVKKPTIAKARARKKAEAAGEQSPVEKATEAKSTRTKKTAEKPAKTTTKKKTARKTSAKAKPKSEERVGGA